MQLPTVSLRLERKKIRNIPQTRRQPGPMPGPASWFNSGQQLPGGLIPMQLGNHIQA